MRCAESIRMNLDNVAWFKEAKEIFENIRQKEDKMEKDEDEDFKEKLINDNPSIFQAIEQNAQKTNIEFLKFILQNHPYDGYKGENPEEQMKKNSKMFIRKLKGKYTPRYLEKDTYDQKVKYTIFHVISCKLNDLFPNLDAELKTER